MNLAKQVSHLIRQHADALRLLNEILGTIQVAIERKHLTASDPRRFDEIRALWKERFKEIEK